MTKKAAMADLNGVIPENIGYWSDTVERGSGAIHLHVGFLLAFADAHFTTHIYPIGGRGNCVSRGIGLRNYFERTGRRAGAGEQAGARGRSGSTGFEGGGD